MSDPRTIQIRSCSECPFLHWVRTGEQSSEVHCDHPEGKGILTHPMEGAPPDWCPLRSASTVVMLVHSQPTTLIDLTLACACGTPADQLPTVDDLGKRWRSCVACGYTQEIGVASPERKKGVYRFAPLPEDPGPIGPECFRGSDYPDLRLQDPEPRKGCLVNSNKLHEHEFRKGDMTCLCGKYSYLGHLAPD